MRRLRRAHQKHARENRKFKRRMVSAGVAAAITLGTAAITNKALAADPPDQHQLPVAQDADADLLADAEESALAYLDFNPDQNRNGTPDGVELAKFCAADINDLPWDKPAEPNGTYKIGHYAFGLETCDICPTQVNMGFLEIINLKRGLNVTCPFISLHYMEHGSFSFAGNVHNGRLDVSSLLETLERRLPWDPNDHQLPVPKDADNDLLSNNEESAIGYRPFDPDQNRNQIPDGVELAKRCAAVVAKLPEQHQAEPSEIYKIEHLLRGEERCHICAKVVNMGGSEIINPKLNLRYPDPNDPLEGLFLPYLALHYMEHGSFDCYGDIHKGRVNLQRLTRVLQLRYPYDPNEHQLPLNYVKGVGQLAPDANDIDKDLLADSEELSAGYNLYNSDQDANLNPDGIELAKQCAEVIDALPVYHGGDPPKEVYKIDFFQDGIELCEICGKRVNMGFWQIINPKLGLSMDVYDVACHYMSHGSFSYDGGIHDGRIKIALLTKILEMPTKCGDLGTIYLPGDSNKDCKVDFKDFAGFADKWLGCSDPNEDKCDN